MRKLVLSLVIFVFLSASIGMNLWGEDIKFPQPSPKASITQAVGLTDITIDYHRPSVKGRTIWGDLVPWDKNWRTGANEATLIKFSTDVTIGDKKVSMGEYALFTIPGKAEWTFILSKQIKIWGNMGYKDSEDVVRVKAVPAAAPHCESMQFSFGKLTESSVMVNLQWEKVMVGFDVKVDTKAAVMASVKKNMGRYWVAPYQVANYAMGKDMMKKAKKFIHMSTSIQKVYWNLLLKAKIYQKFLAAEKDKKMAKKMKKKVIMILEAAVASVKELPEGQQKYVAGNPEAEKMLKECKTKK